MEILSNLAQEIEKNVEIQKTLSKEEQFNYMKALLKQAIEQEDVSGIAIIVNKHLKDYVSNHRSIELYPLLLAAENMFLREDTSQLSGIYLTIGHIFFFELNYMVARKYYDLSISYGMKYKNYHSVSLAINNILASKNEKRHDLQLGLELSKVTPILYKAMPERIVKIDQVVKRLYVHLEFLIMTDRLDEAEQLLKKIVEGIYVKENSREYIQLTVYGALILSRKSLHKEALEIYNTTIKLCIEGKSNNDIVDFAYRAIIKANKFLSKEQNEKVEGIKDSYFAEKTMRKKYLQELDEQLNPEMERAFGVVPSLFDQQATTLFEQLEGEGHTLILIDSLLMNNDKKMMESILNEIHHAMKEAFQGAILLVSIFDQSTLAYVIPLSEQEIDERCATVFKKIRGIFPPKQEELKAIYYGSVNNKKHGYDSYEKCRSLANAYIYYEMHKKE